MIFGPHFEGFQGSRPRKILEKKLRLQLNNFTQKLDFDFCGLGEDECTRFEKKKRKKREKKEIKGKIKKKKKKERKNLIAAKSGLVGMKGYHKTYNCVKYFLPYLSRF